MHPCVASRVLIVTSCWLLTPVLATNIDVVAQFTPQRVIAGVPD